MQCAFGYLIMAGATYVKEVLLVAPKCHLCNLSVLVRHPCSLALACSGSHVWVAVCCRLWLTTCACVAGCGCGRITYLWDCELYCRAPVLGFKSLWPMQCAFGYLIMAGATYVKELLRVAPKCHLCNLSVLVQHPCSSLALACSGSHVRVGMVHDAHRL